MLGVEPHSEPHPPTNRMRFSNEVPPTTGLQAGLGSLARCISKLSVGGPVEHHSEPHPPLPHWFTPTYLHCLRTTSVHLCTISVRIGTTSTTGFPLSKWSQYGLKRYTNGLISVVEVVSIRTETVRKWTEAVCKWTEAVRKW